MKSDLFKQVDCWTGKQCGILEGWLPLWVKSTCAELRLKCGLEVYQVNNVQHGTAALTVLPTAPDSPHREPAGVILNRHTQTV